MASYAERRAKESHGSSKRERYMLPDELLEYLLRIEGVVSAEDTLADDEARDSLVSNCLEEIEGQELKVMMERDGSRVLEKILKLATKSQVVSLLQKTTTKLLELSYDRCASHVLETALGLIAPHCGEAPDGAEVEEDNEEEGSGMTPRDIVLKICEGQSGNGTTRVEAGYPNGIHKHTNLESQCPVGHFVEGVVVDFRGTMHGKCDHDGAAAGSVRFQCRKFTDFLTEKQFMDGPCRTTTSTPSFANAVYSWKTGIRATCSDGQLVTGMSVLHGGSCHNRCDGDMCPMRQITLHCRNVSDYFCPLF